MKVLTNEKEHEAYIKKYYDSNYLAYLTSCVFIYFFMSMVIDVIFDGVSDFKASFDFAERMVNAVLWALFFSLIMRLFNKRNNRLLYPHKCEEHFQAYDYYLSSSSVKKVMAESGLLLIDEKKIAFVRKKKKDYKMIIELEHIKAEEISVERLKKHYLTRFLLGSKLDYLKIQRGNEVYKFYLHNPEYIRNIILDIKKVD